MSEEGKSWLERLYQALIGEPKDQEELLEVIRNANDRDLLDEQSLMMIEGVLQVSIMPVSDVMIPKLQMVVIPANSSLAQIMPIVTESQHSRYPVMSASGDEVIGILLAKDLLPFQMQDASDDFDLDEIVRPAVFIPESKRLDVLLQEFRRNRNHMAIVVDEYGVVAGLVTIEDVLEQIVGEIEDEFDVEEDAYIKKHNDKTYIIKALTPVDDFNEYFKTKIDDKDFDTIGGIIMHALGHVPKRDETVRIEENLQFKVLRADKRRVQLLELTLTTS